MKHRLPHVRQFAIDEGHAEPTIFPALTTQLTREIETGDAAANDDDPMLVHSHAHTPTEITQDAVGQARRADRCGAPAGNARASSFPSHGQGLLKRRIADGEFRLRLGNGELGLQPLSVRSDGVQRRGSACGVSLPGQFRARARRG